MNDDITNLELGYQSTTKYRIHPSVPLSILEFYYRKKPNVIVGTLLGLVFPDHIDITNCYSVPYLTTQDGEKKSKEIAIDKDYHRKLHNLNQRIFPKEVTVGFFITQTEFDSNIGPLNQFYSNSKDSYFSSTAVLQNPIILTIDPEMSLSKFDMKAFMITNLSILKESFITFSQLNLIMEFFEEDRNEISPMVSKQLMIQQQQDQNQLDIVNIDNIESLLTDVIKHLKTIQEYIKNVKEQKIKVNPKIAKTLKKLLNLRPMLSKDEFSQLIAKHMQDVVLFMFLSNVANTQAMIMEKLIKI